MPAEDNGSGGLSITVTPADIEAAKAARAAADAEAAKAAAPADNAEAPNPDAPVRPEWLPEEFWNAETGVADYEGLAKRYAEKAAEKPAEVPKETEGDKADEKPADAATNADYLTLRERADKELSESGELSEETYAGYEKAGIPREHIDLHIEGLKAIVELRQMSAYTEAGGQEAYEQMVEWAKTSLSPEEAEAYNNAVFNGSKTEMLVAIRGLRARFQTEAGREGTPVAAAKPGAAVGDTFETRAELVKAMNDERYRKDANYREEVRAKLHRSIAAGKKVGL